MNVDTDAGRLAAFAATHDSFTPAVLAQGRRMLVDQLACQIVGATLPWSRAYRDAVIALGPGSGASVVYYGDTLAVDQAAFVNSAFGHAIELDDTHLAAMTHPSQVVVPAVLALAEQRGLGGRAALEAVIVGSEVMLRIAFASAPQLAGRGHCVATSAGPFGAAAACARLLGLDVTATLNAMAIAGSHAAGLMEYNRTGGSVKRIHGAIPAMSGVRCAVMAAHGITGPPTILEGPKGFFAAFAGTYDAARLFAGLGETFLIDGVSFKPVAANFSTHAALEAIGELEAEHALRADEIAAIEIGAARSTLGAVGNIAVPTDLLGAQSSFAFSAAVRLLRGGNGFDDYREEDLRDPRFVALAQRVRLFVDPQCDEEQQRLHNRSAVVRIATTDGRQLERRMTYSKGMPEKPLSDEELDAKFVRAVTPRLGPARAAELVDRIRDIDAAGDVGDVVALTLALARS
jgi:2-methylcitrate dehydratase PrpD